MSEKNVDIPSVFIMPLYFLLHYPLLNCYLSMRELQEVSELSTFFFQFTHAVMCSCGIVYLSWRVPWLGVLQPPHGWCWVVGICQSEVSVVCKAPADQRFCTEARLDEDFQKIAVLEMTAVNATPHIAAELPSTHSAAAPSDPPVRASRTLKDSSVWEDSVQETVLIQTGSTVRRLSKVS